ncbi:MAG: hypothetical protein F6J93_14025 [Oscillatoria sp. SIO1A7]|nr:hypothetical protein [Oscillatoria sp. SIO1A7]
MLSPLPDRLLHLFEKCYIALEPTICVSPGEALQVQAGRSDRFPVKLLLTRELARDR